MTRQTTIEKKKEKGKNTNRERDTQTHNKQESPLNIIETNVPLRMLKFVNYCLSLELSHFFKDYSSS
jgi:hypothetical protein